MPCGVGILQPMLAKHKLDVLDILAEASRILASSFEVAETLPRVADLCIRSIADYCAIYATVGDEAGITLVEAAPQPGLHLRARSPDAFPALLREHGFESVAACRIHGRSARGIFVLAKREPDALSSEYQKLVNILSLQITNVLDHSELFARTHRVADRLQRALLPETLPLIPGTVLHAAYKPASDEAEVGGDWYDAFHLPDGRVALSMGDVAGHGLSAATIMGEVRQAMRTTAVFEHSPSTVLEHINNVINLRSGIGMVTAIFGYYEPQNRELTYAVAGHPPPALTIEGSFYGFLPGGGLPLGVDENVKARDWTITLPPRCGLIFYTDGMTEHSRDIFAGEEQLLQAAVRSFEDDKANPAIALQERIFDARANRDDAATLTLTCESGPVPSAMRFSAIPVTAPVARAMIERFCEQHGICDEQRFAIVTAVGEAIANAVEHAYRGDSDPGSYYLRPAVEGDVVTIEIEDGGRWRPFTPRDERGRGMVLMNELMDRVRITSTQSGTNIILTAQLRDQNFTSENTPR